MIRRDTGRYAWLDILKGFGIIFVVIGHFCAIDRVYHWIYSFHMPLFFFASGYLYRKKPIWENVRHKFVTLMVPYFIFGLLSQVHFALNEYIFGREVDISQLILGLLYGTYSSISYNRVLWFLPALFCISNIYNLLKTRGGGQKLLYILVAILTALYVVGVAPSVCPWGLDNRVCEFIIYYMLGNIVAEKGWIENICKLPMEFRYIGALVLVSLNFIVSGYKSSERILEYLIALIGVIGWLLVSISIENHGKILERIGQASLCILCIHVPVGEVLTKILVRTTNMTFANCEIEFRYAFVRCVLTIFICMICYYIIMKVFPWALGKKKKVS